MKVVKIFCNVSKKQWKDGVSHGVSIGAEAKIEDGENWERVIETLDFQLKELVSESLPSPQQGSIRKIMRKLIIGE